MSDPYGTTDDITTQKRWGSTAKTPGKLGAKRSTGNSGSSSNGGGLPIYTAPPKPVPAPSRAKEQQQQQHSGTGALAAENDAFRRGMPWLFLALLVSIGAVYATPPAYSVPYIATMVVLAVALPACIFYTRTNTWLCGAIFVVWAWCVASSVALFSFGLLGSIGGVAATFVILAMVAMFLMLDDLYLSRAAFAQDPLRPVLVGVFSFVAAVILVLLLVAPLSAIGLIVVMVVAVCVIQIVHLNTKALRTEARLETLAGPWVAFRLMLNVVFVWLCFA